MRAYLHRFVLSGQSGGYARNFKFPRLMRRDPGGLGCDVALDDFGTGFGSFSHLKHLPTRYLKIDVEFVRELASNITDQHVVRSITDVGHSLDKLIIAEGVEDQAILQALREYGVDYAQGMYLGAPERISPPRDGSNPCARTARHTTPRRSSEAR